MKKYDVVYGRRFTGKDGLEGTQWLRCGAVIEKNHPLDPNRTVLSLKLDLIPVGVGTDGLWFGLFEPKADDKPVESQRRKPADELGTEDIPF